MTDIFEFMCSTFVNADHITVVHVLGSSDVLLGEEPEAWTEGGGSLHGLEILNPSSSSKSSAGKVAKTSVVGCHYSSGILV